MVLFSMKKFQPSKVLMVVAGVCVLQLAGCDQGSRESASTESAGNLDAQTQQRIDDLTAVNAALQQYHTLNNAYPVSNQIQGYASAYGASLGADWIPELSQALPRDPAGSEAGNEAQYLYVSDGTNYKLIAHATGDCSPAVASNGVQIDPRRNDGTSCWAYGFWSAGGEAF